MSYEVLARKLRPLTFDEVIGQEAIATTLKNGIETGRIHHAFLFTGTRGVGKTTMARILAKALNCLKASAPTTQPCGKCDSCESIHRGDDVDVMEIDGASNRGIDDIRQLRDNAAYRPARARHKVYIIDEVHQVTRDAFNALLKTLEEPPSHVKFIFATTEPHRVPATILSRCQRYDFRNIGTDQIAGYMAGICKSEKVKVDDAVIRRIALSARGSMRDGLSLLDQLLSASGDKIDGKLLDDLLGTTGWERMVGLGAAILGRNSAEALTELSGLIGSGLALEQIAAGLIDHFRNLMVLSVCGEKTELVPLPGEGIKQLQAQMEGVKTPELIYMIGLAEDLRRSLRGLGTTEALVEAGVVRLAARDEFFSVSALAERLRAESGDRPTAPAPRPAPTARPVPAARRPQAAPRPQAASARPAAPAINQKPSKAELAQVFADPLVRQVMDTFDGTTVDVKKV